MLPISVIVPVRNAELMVSECLAAISRTEPGEIIVVDGNSTDRTLEIARQYPVKILSDDGRGVSAARMMGIQAAKFDTVALIDADIVLGEEALANLYNEFMTGRYDGLQAGLVSIAVSSTASKPGYWGRALVYHHNNGRSKNWPGVMATLFRKEVLLRYPFDERFRSGEDIELRWRLKNAGLKLGVSKTTLVQHRFGDTYEVARDQWLQDGKGLGRMFARYGLPAASHLVIPAAGCVRGILLCLVRLQPAWIPYYLGYLVYNYVAMLGGMGERFDNHELVTVG